MNNNRCINLVINIQLIISKGKLGQDKKKDTIGQTSREHSLIAYIIKTVNITHSSFLHSVPYKSCNWVLSQTLHAYTGTEPHTIHNTSFSLFLPP